MIGIVLSGGKSSRMGSDKGLMQTNGVSWAQMAFSKLNSLVPDCYISVNEQQAAIYASSFSDQLLIKDNAALAIAGPVLGLLSVHMLFPKDAIIVLACDMIFMDPEPIKYLLKNYQQQNQMETYLFANENGLQPLMAIYSSDLLARVLAQLQAGTLHNFSVKHLVDISKNFLAIVPPAWQQSFINVNAAQDLDKPAD